MSLTAVTVKNAKPRAKNYRLWDAGGLYLEVATSGGKWWRLKFRVSGREKRLSLGVYPDVTLKDARLRRDEQRKLLAEGIDPSEKRKAKRAETVLAATSTFEKVAREWFDRNRPRWKPGHAETVISRLERDVFPAIGKKPISGIDAPILLTVLKGVERRGAVETARRIRGICGQVFRYAVANRLVDRDPSADLKGAIVPKKIKGHAFLSEPKRVGELLRAMDVYSGHFVTRAALQLTPLVFVRPGELRHAEWSEIDLKKSTWTIAAEKMKMSQRHLVPLSRQALGILHEMQPLTGEGRYVFPSVRTNTRPLSENTINATLRKLGYTKEEQTAHGFRSTASTLLNESGVWNRDAIERQLAHGERDKVRASYNFAEHLEERKKMMQWWADYLDELKDGR